MIRKLKRILQGAICGLIAVGFYVLANRAIDISVYTREQKDISNVPRSVNEFKKSELEKIEIPIKNNEIQPRINVLLDHEPSLKQIKQPEIPPPKIDPSKKFNSDLQKAFNSIDFSNYKPNRIFNPNKPLVFLHIGKTGGSSFDSKIAQQVSKVKGKYVGYKHFDWAYIENKYKSGVDQVVTLMREPVDRAISHFYFHVTKTSGVKDEIRKYWAVLD